MNIQQAQRDNFMTICKAEERKGARMISCVQVCALIRCPAAGGLLLHGEISIDGSTVD